MNEQLSEVKKRLEGRGFQVSLFASAAEAAEYLCAQVLDTSVGIGGSVTVKEMGLFDRLCERNEVWWHNDEEQLARFGDEEIRRRASQTEAYISSVNGLSADGVLVNIDGRGNRVAATAYGHRRVFFLVGRNKLAPDLAGAIWRARNIAAPKNARRLGLKTPCAVGGRCYDCSSPARICRGVFLMESPMNGQKTEIILIDADLGY